MKDDDKSPLPAWICVLDAKERDKKNKELYSDEQIELGEKLLSKVSSCYDAVVYRNYRERFIAVKVDKPSRMNKTSNAVAELHKWCAANDIEVVTRGKNVLYHIKLKKETP